MDQFTRIFETPYEITDIDDFNCNIDRRSPDISPSDMMYVMNHFLYSVFEIGALKIEIPAKNKAAVTNSQSLIDHTINCTMVFERKPNFVEVDFYNIGDVLDLIEELNGIAASNNNSMNSNVQELVKNIAATSHNPNRKKQNIQYQYNASSTLTISVCFPFCLLTLAFFLPFVLY
jgi:hypothetical protein